jgi:hypothetical protein
MRGVIVYGNSAALLSEKMNFMRDNLPIFWELKARQTAAELTPERIWTEGFIRQGYDMQRGLRALSVLLRRAEEGELSILQEESPRTQALRNARLRAALWTALTLMLTWLTVTLREASLVGGIKWWMLGLVGVLLCLWQLATALRRLG